MSKKRGFFSSAGSGIKKLHREIFRVIDQGLDLGDKLIKTTKLDKVLGGGSIGVSTSSGSSGGHNVNYTPPNSSTSIGFGISNNSGSPSLFVNNQATMPLITPPAQFTMQSVEDKIAERDQLLREVYGPGYIPESSLATISTVAIGSAATQLVHDTVDFVNVISDVHADTWAVIYSINDHEKSEALSRNRDRAVNVVQSMSQLASNPSMVPMYYAQHTEEAANVFAAAYSAGNLTGAGAATGQIVYDLGNTACLTAGVFNFTAKAAANAGTQVNNFAATHNFRSPMTFQYDYAKLNSGIPLDAVKLQNPVVNISQNIAVQPAKAGKLTKRQIAEYLQNVDKIPLEQLIVDLQKIGLELYNPELIAKVGIYKFKYTNLKTGVATVFVEIHKAKGPNDYHHMHIMDWFGNVYDKDLNNLTAKFRKNNPGWHKNKVREVVKVLPEAHIKIKEFVELNIRLENV